MRVTVVVAVGVGDDVVVAVALADEVAVDSRVARVDGD